jgi:hypothetical protein
LVKRYKVFLGGLTANLVPVSPTFSNRVPLLSSFS